MNIFRKIFRKKKYNDLSDLDNLSEKLPPIPGESQMAKAPELQAQGQKIHLDNVKVKLDLILTDLDNVKTQNKLMTERLKK